MEPWKIQGSIEWLRFRQERIGGSDAGIIDGSNKYSSPYRLWQEKTGRAKVFVNEYMKEGTRLEPKARSWYETQTGIAMFPDVKVHKNHPWMMSSIDGVDLSGKKGLELKCPNIKNHIIAMKGEVPPHNFAQLQHNMEVFELDSIDFVSYHEHKVKDPWNPDKLLIRPEGCIITVYPDKEYVQRLIETESIFFQWIKQDRFPLQPTDKVSEEVYDLIVQLKETKELSDLYSEKYDELRDKLIAASGKEFNAHGCTLKKTKTSGTVSYSDIPELKNIDLEKYRSPSKEKWTLTMKC